MGAWMRKHWRRAGKTEVAMLEQSNTFKSAILSSVHSEIRTHLIKCGAGSARNELEEVREVLPIVETLIGGRWPSAAAIILVPSPRLVLPIPAPVSCSSETAVDEGFVEIESTRRRRSSAEPLAHRGMIPDPICWKVAGLGGMIPVG